MKTFMFNNNVNGSFKNFYPTNNYKTSTILLKEFRIAVFSRNRI